jgi:UDP-N-acetylmuramate: L-alanyl-gamma-D-glutamyl-meso-diaminopimelate ligase
MHIHVLGICGTFMAGLAALATELGHKVTGCDQNVYPPMSTFLDSLGISVMEGYDESQLSLKPDLFIIGNVVSRGNKLNGGYSQSESLFSIWARVALPKYFKR